MNDILIYKNEPCLILRKKILNLKKKYFNKSELLKLPKLKIYYEIWRNSNKEIILDDSDDPELYQIFWLKFEEIEGYHLTQYYITEETI